MTISPELVGVLLTVAGGILYAGRLLGRIEEAAKRFEKDASRVEKTANKLEETIAMIVDHDRRIKQVENTYESMRPMLHRASSDDFDS